MSAYVAWLFLAGALAAPDDGNASYDEVVDFTVPWDLDADRYDALLEDAAGRAPVGSRQVRLLGWGEDGVLRPLDAYLPVLPSPEDKDPWEGQRAADHPGPTPGALSGKAVYLSQCHGWIWSDVLNRFATQRGNNHDTVEDFHNPEGMNQILTAYLENAGASVFTTGERDINPEMALADNDGVGYAETGTGFEDGLAGFADTSPYVYGEDPFDAGTTRRFPANSGSVATWTPTVPSDGHYAVYVTWDAASDHATDAHYRLTHPGGVIDRWYDQTAHGSTWQYVETLWLTAGSSLTVELIGDSASSDPVSADAVRIGGGVGDVDREGVTSAMPRWQEGAIQYTQFNGAPSSIYDPYGTGDGSDPTSRSRWADWEHPLSEDAVYLSWHSNASAYGTARGTITYFAGGGSDAPASYPAACYVSGDAVDGSYSLSRAVQDELIESFQTRWDASWQDRGLGTACFSEVSPGNNDEMPATLVELAFHDNYDDSLYLKHPRFRHDASRAMYRGIVRYFAERDGLVPTFVPEPPVEVALVHDGAGQLLLTWAEGPTGAPLGDAPDHYRVYLSTDGRSWDNGLDVYGSSAGIALPQGDAVYARVAGVNAGGTGFPSEVVGARLSPDDRAGILVVGAFDRLDRGMLEWEYAHSSLGDVVRMDLHRMNDWSIIVAHGQAIAGAGWFFDSASDEAAAAMDLGDYDLVVWATGEESTADESFSDAQQTQLRAFWDAGGAVWASGAEIFWDLDYLGSATDQAFADDVLGAGMASDQAGSTDVNGLDVLSGVGPMDFGVEVGAPYPVEWPDVLASSRTPIAEYLTGEVAAVLGSGVATFGFPFEAIADPDVRIEVAAALLPALIDGYTPPDVPDDTGIATVTGTRDTGTPATSSTPGGGESPRVPMDGKQGCGCTAGSVGAAGWVIWLGLALGIRRR